MVHIESKTKKHFVCFFVCLNLVKDFDIIIFFLATFTAIAGASGIKAVMSSVFLTSVVAITLL